MNGSAFWILLALLSASLEPVVAKFGYRDGVTPWQLLVLKNFFALLAILPISYVVSKKAGGWRWVGVSGLATVASVSLLLLVTNACSLWALAKMPAITVITLMTTTPAFVALTNQWQGRDKLTKKFWLGLIVCSSGVLMSLNIFDQNLSFEPLGVLFVIGAIISSTIYRTRMEVVTKQFPPIIVSTYIFIVNALVSLLVIFPFLSPISSEGYGVGLWVGTAAAVANVAFLYALSIVGSTNMSVFNLLQRPIVLIVAALFLKEDLTNIQILGTILVLVGVRFAQVKRT